MKQENADQLKVLHDTVYECVMALETQEITVDTILIHILLHKFDTATLVNYECQLADAKELQSLKDFLSYVENRFMALQSAKAKGMKKPIPHQITKKIRKNTNVFAAKQSTQSTSVKSLTKKRHTNDLRSQEQTNCV